MVGEGFEPSKSVTADLQSAPFGRSGTPPDLMVPTTGIELAVDQIVTMDRMGKKSAENLVKAINDSKSRGLDRVLYIRY